MQRYTTMQRPQDLQYRLFPVQKILTAEGRGKDRENNTRNDIYSLSFCKWVASARVFLAINNGHRRYN